MSTAKVLGYGFGMDELEYLKFIADQERRNANAGPVDKQNSLPNRELVLQCERARDRARPSVVPNNAAAQPVDRARPARIPSPTARLGVRSASRR